jgi:hypothetical protein
MIASGALNKMTSLGMPKSRRSAWILWKKTLRGVKKQRRIVTYHLALDDPLVYNKISW